MTPAPQYRPTWPAPTGVPLIGHSADRFRTLAAITIGARIARTGAPFTTAAWIAATADWTDEAAA